MLHRRTEAYITEGSIVQDGQQRMNVAFTGEVQPGPDVSLWGHHATRIPETDHPQLYTTIILRHYFQYVHSRLFQTEDFRWKMEQ